MKRIGLLTSGGDCQALNAAMRGVVKSMMNSGEQMEIYYNETNSAEAIKSVSSSSYDLGIVRTAANHEKYFRELFDELLRSI